MKQAPIKQSENKTPLRISMVAFQGADILDITGPLDVFTIAGVLLQENGRISMEAMLIVGSS